MSIRIERTLGALGAEIGGVDVSLPLDKATLREIFDAWLRHQVLVFRNQTLDDAALVAFSARFGKLEKAPIAEKAVGVVHVPRLPEVTVVSNVVEGGVPLGALGDGELSWHSDMTYLPTPPPASILYGVEVPPVGADTWFNTMYLAYETLPAGLKTRIAGLRSNHTSSYTSAGTLRKGFADVTDPTSAPGTLHPLVIEHPETHRKALYLGRRLHGYVEGLSLSESESLLEQLWLHATKEEFAIAHKWKRGDVVMWDNRCVMHRRDAFDPKVRRILHRTQLLSFEVH
ncbi:MAG: TauD/TfdA dioxygenase family protein [Burkholderiales bacterium]